MMGTRAIVLAQLTSGTRATVLGTVAGANPVIAKRLGQLGFRAKARVDVVRRAPLGDPTIYRVHDTDCVCAAVRRSSSKSSPKRTYDGVP